MNNIQKLISEMEAGASNAKAEVKKYKKNGRELNEFYHFGWQQALEAYIPKLKLLLKDESKQPQPPISQTQMLGEVPHEVNDQQEECTQAVEGATPVVRQNEQMQKSCDYCIQYNSNNWPLTSCYCPNCNRKVC